MGPIDDLAQFRWRLAETIAFCAPPIATADPLSSLWAPVLRPPGFLWSPALRPAAFLGDEASDEYTPYSWYDNRSFEEHLAEIQAAIEEVARRRADLLRSAGRYPSTPAQGLANGRLVVFFPNGTAFDGATEAETHGFFDDFNVPAWDTWLWSGYHGAGNSGYRTYMVSWVPPKLVELVGEGIAVNPEQCIRWADETEIPLAIQLRAADFIA